MAAEETVIAIHGPRSVGKSTLLREFAQEYGVDVLDLDDEEVCEAARANPSAVAGRPAPICIDEYQHLPEVLGALKTRLNREPAAPGLAVLTGSTRQDALPRTAQTLTGRLHPFTLLPIAQSEIEGTRLNVVSELRSDPDGFVARLPTSPTTRRQYAERICAGGFPIALQRSSVRARDRWFDDYVRATVERDAMELMRLRERQSLREVLDRLVSQSAQLLHVTGVANGLEIARKTVEGYIRLLEDLFLIMRLPAWGRTLAARVVAAPKVHAIDSGVAAYLLHVNEATLATLDPAVLTEFGHLLETFVVGELMKHLSWLAEPAVVGHWRTRDGDEVDIVIEFHDGRVLGFEVKANERITDRDLKGLRKLRDLLGERFIAGIALSTGGRSYSSGDRVHVMPVDRLWRAWT
ncbi:MAG: ATP-binding protein [Microbacterium sp.]